MDSITYKGLFFDSMKILPIYSPKIPTDTSWIPPRNNITVSKEA